MSIRPRASALAAAFLLAACSHAPGLVGRDGGESGVRAVGKAWGYLALSASDNDLAEDARVLEDAVTRGVALPNLAPVLYVDRDGPDDSARLFGGPQGLVRERVPELDSESPAAVRALLDFARKRAPARREVLILADHGGGIVRGINSDEHRPAGAAAHDVADFARVLGKPVDILYFDACYMQMVEVAHDFAGRAEVILASESETTSGSAPHGKFLEVLDAGGRAGTDEVARRLVEAGSAMARRDATLSAVRVAGVAAMIKPLGRLAADLTAAVRADKALKERLRDALGKAQPFGFETDPHYRLYNSYRDLGDTLDRIAQVAPAVAEQARALAAHLRREVVLAHAEARTFGRASGLAIYAPAGDVVAAEYLESAFSRETGWGDFLVQLNAGGKWASPIQRDPYPRALGRRRKG